MPSPSFLMLLCSPVLRPHHLLPGQPHGLHSRPLLIRHISLKPANLTALPDLLSQLKNGSPPPGLTTRPAFKASVFGCQSIPCCAFHDTSTSSHWSKEELRLLLPYTALPCLRLSLWVVPYSPSPCSLPAGNPIHLPRPPLMLLRPETFPLPCSQDPLSIPEDAAPITGHPGLPLLLSLFTLLEAALGPVL